jgi:hypothetical protein
MDLIERLSAWPTDDDADERWAASGAMALTGRRDGPPLLVPQTVSARIDSWSAVVRRQSASLGKAVGVDGVALLGERAVLSGRGRDGERSVGGSTRLLQAADGWLALALARSDDIAAVPAWLEQTLDVGGDIWTAVACRVADRERGALVERARLLDLACAPLGEVPPRAGPVVGASKLGPGPARRSLRDVLVVDLSSLWAGPLCTNLLAMAGARVVKVESRGRPDGARSGDAAFFDLLNAGKESVVLDLPRREAVGRLVALLRRADVVVESSRPRALGQLGIAAPEIAAGGRLRVWLSITGYGRAEGVAHRVAFGDDAAVAGGLVARDSRGPVFCADAVADPASGLLAAAVVLDRLAAGGRWHVDIALARTAAHLADGPVTAASWAGAVAPPRARPSRGRAPALGQHDERWLGQPVS